MLSKNTFHYVTHLLYFLSSCRVSEHLSNLFLRYLIRFHCILVLNRKDVSIIIMREREREEGFKFADVCAENNGVRILSLYFIIFENLSIFDFCIFSEKRDIFFLLWTEYIRAQNLVSVDAWYGYLHNKDGLVMFDNLFY